MDTTELDRFVTMLADDLTPTAAETGTGVGFVLASAEAVVDDDKLAAIMTAGFRMVAIGNYLMAAAADRAHAIGVPARQNLKTGRDLLGQLPLAPAAVARLGRLADNLAALPDLAREVRDGDLSLEHADAVIRGLGHVSSRLDVNGFAENKNQIGSALLQEARWGTPAQVADKARTIAHELAPDHPPVIAPAENPLLNTATIARTDEGRVTVEADLDQLSGETLITALDALSAPNKDLPDGDPRTRGQRLADGLVDIVNTYLANPDRPVSGGVVPHITLTVPLPTLLPANGGRVPSSAAPAVLAGGLDTPCSASASPGTRPPTRQPSTTDGDRTSETGGESPPWWSSDFEALAEKSYRDPHTTIAHLGFTGAVSTSQARALCCGNPELTAIVMADGIPIDVKPTARFATGALRKALVARDRGCQFPGVDDA
ncbi:DUF222 domain-containing protein [Gordonia sp. X0973]|uniref:DUF222 domain-containing protein n=1 Tax=Gordonia sp. X0973 TaxID=2742602 RepID=UPI0026574FCC|nr:DUF222 domain-containing protein [Gordonia sp. X0973]